VDTALMSYHHSANSVVAKEIFRGIFHFMNRFTQRLLFPLVKICLRYLETMKFGPDLSCHFSTVDCFQIFEIRLHRPILRWGQVRQAECRLGAGLSLRTPIFFHDSLGGGGVKWGY